MAEKCCRCLLCLQPKDSLYVPGRFASGFRAVVTMCARCRKEAMHVEGLEIRWAGKLRNFYARKGKE